MAEDNELYVVSAFYTDDGAAAYLQADGTWTGDLQKAKPVDASKRDEWIDIKARDDQRAVCDPYGFKVEVKDGVIDPLSARETIRAKGPTTRVRRPD